MTKGLLLALFGLKDIGIQREMLIKDVIRCVFLLGDAVRASYGSFGAGEYEESDKKSFGSFRLKIIYFI